MKYEIIGAAKNNSVQQIKLLIQENPACIDLQDEEGYTAIAWAAGKGHLEAFQTLLQAGANLSIISQNNTNLWHAAAQGSNSGIIRILIKKHTTTTVDDLMMDGWTPMHIAVVNKHQQIIDLLKPYSKIDAQYFFLERQIFLTFGGTLIKTKKIEQHFKSFPCGGNFHQDTLGLIIPKLKMFLDSERLELKKYTTLLETLEEAEINKPIPSHILTKSKSILIRTGYNEHYIAAYLEPLPKSTDWQLSIYDRGEFNDYLITDDAQKNEERCPFIARIIVIEKNLFWIIDKLNETCEVNREPAINILFKEIPTKLGKNWITDATYLRKGITTDTCYIENFLSFLADQILKIEGSNGNKIFNKWLIFFYKSVLEPYEFYCHSNENIEEIAKEIILACENIIEKKSKNLAKKDDGEKTDKLVKIMTTAKYDHKPFFAQHIIDEASEVIEHQSFFINKLGS